MATAADTRDVGLAQQLSTATSGGNSPLDKLLQHQAKVSILGWRHMY